MRFLLDHDENILGLYDVITISEMYAVPTWASESNAGDIPNGIFVYFSNNNSDVADELEGEYNLDGTEETYQAAIANYNKICEQLLVSGYARMSDFENFIWTDI